MIHCYNFEMVLIENKQNESVNYFTDIDNININAFEIFSEYDN